MIGRQLPTHYVELTERGARKIRSSNSLTLSARPVGYMIGVEATAPNNTPCFRKLFSTNRSFSCPVEHLSTIVPDAIGARLWAGGTASYRHRPCYFPAFLSNQQLVPFERDPRWLSHFSLRPKTQSIRNFSSPHPLWACGTCSARGAGKRRCWRPISNCSAFRTFSLWFGLLDSTDHNA